MVSRVLRVYVDTSVFGGCLDDEFTVDSLRVMELARSGRLTLIVSDVVVAELAPAPRAVREMMQGLPESAIELWDSDAEIGDLRDAYIKSGVLTSRWIDDAAHVAAATVARADALVSWNFRHVVRLDRIKAFNQVNLANGYGVITILSPTELREHETRDDTRI